MESTKSSKNSHLTNADSDKQFFKDAVNSHSHNSSSNNLADLSLNPSISAPQPSKRHKNHHHNNNNSSLKKTTSSSASTSGQ